MTDPASNSRPSGLSAFALAAVVAADVLFSAPAASAGGFENPDDVALGLLNWAYPKALYVRTAVWQAEEAGILPPREAKPATDLFGSGFRRAATSMNGLGKRLNTGAPASAGKVSFAVVVIPAVMWTRYEPGDEGYSVRVHADGPVKGDVVIVTDEKVVRAIVEGSFDADYGEAHGLLRFYGPDERQRAVRGVLAASTSANTGGPIEASASSPAWCHHESPSSESTAAGSSLHESSQAGRCIEDGPAEMSMSKQAWTASDARNGTSSTTGNK